MKKILLIISLFFLSRAEAQIITTIAGDGGGGYNGDDTPAISAELARPVGIAIDGAGNVYIGDRDNNRIRKINSVGTINTIAGTGVPAYMGNGGAATAALINQPYGVAVDNVGNVYFADGGNRCIRKINTSGIITTIAGNDTSGYNGDNIPATTAELNGVAGVAVDASGNIYITDGGNNRVRKVNTAGIITTIAGTGAGGHSGDNAPATAAELNGPYAILLDGSGNIYIGEELGYCVRKINTTGIITTIAGTDTGGFSGDNGPATAAKITQVLGLAMDAAGSLYISDYYNYRIRKVNASGIITTYSGDGNGDYNGDEILASTAQLGPTGLVLDATGNLYVADFGNERIRRITSTVVFVSNINNVVEHVLIYPNPTNGDFTISISSCIDEQAFVVITNAAGEKVKELNAATNKPLNIKLDERVGLYFISITTAHQTWCEKLLVIPP